MNEVSQLFECRNCGGVVASKQLHCPYCKYSKGPEKEVYTLDGSGTKTVNKNWYRLLNIKPKE